jgi:hypothetical protein
VVEDAVEFHEKSSVLGRLDTRVHDGPIIAEVLGDTGDNEGGKVDVIPAM